MDCAAATPVDRRVVRVMAPYFSEHYGNPSALHKEGRVGREAVENARRVIAGAIHANPREIIFTSGGTEANNLAILGVVDISKLSDVHLVTSVIEHPSVLDCFVALESRGARVNYVGVNGDGILDLDEFTKVVRPETELISIMFANNEIGTLQPIRDVVRIAKKKCRSVIVHTDAAQASLFYKLDVRKLGVDLLTIDGQKIYGPKGVGALFKRFDVSLNPIFHGGKQEYMLRAGTENVPGIVGFAKAYEIADLQRDRDARRIQELRDYFMEGIRSVVPSCVVNGSLELRMPDNINVSFPDVEGEFLVLQLDEAGIACSARSACFGAGGEGSAVVAALDSARAMNAVRFSLGRETTKKDIDYTLKILAEKVGVQS